MTTDIQGCLAVTALLEKEGLHPEAIIDGKPFDPMFFPPAIKTHPVVQIIVPPEEVTGAKHALEAWQLQQIALSAQASSNGFKMLMISVAASLVIGSAVFAFSHNSMAAFEAGVVGFSLTFAIALVQFESARKNKNQNQI
jgi:hypothetical protein